MKLTNDFDYPEDERYLNKEFPKGKTKFRGQAIVLLTLSRHQGTKEQRLKFKEYIDKRIKKLKELTRNAKEDIEVLNQYYARINELKLI